MGPTITPPMVLTPGAPLVPERGHYCHYELRGESCPGPSGCSGTGPNLYPDNPCYKGGVRDGVRCTCCGRWAETPRDISHNKPGCHPKLAPPRGRRTA